MAASKKLTVYRARSLLTSNSHHDIFEDAFLAVEGEFIRDVGPWAKRPRASAAVQVDYSHGLITPGLFNLHCHLPMVMLRGIAEDVDFHSWLYDYILPVEAQWVGPEFCKLGAELAAIELIRHGITFVSEMYYFEEHIAEVIDRVGIRCLVGQHVWDQKAPDFETPDQTFDSIRRMSKKYAAHPRIIPSVNPHAPYTCSQEIVRECVTLANELKIPVVTHLAESEWEVQEIKKNYGVSPVHYMKKAGLFDADRLLLAHMVWPDGADFEVLQDERVSVVLNPKCNAKLASGVAPIESYHQKSIRWTLGTDGAASNNSMDILSEMSFLAKLHHLHFKNLTGLPGPDIFSAGTLRAAEAVGLGSQLGSLEPGKRADFIVIDTRAPHLTPFTDPYAHLIYSATGADVEATYINGKALMRNRKILSTDAPKVYARADAMWKKIKASLKNKPKPKR